MIVLENLGFSWLSKWHYSVVTGYDLEREEVTMHSGSEADKSKRLDFFERGWKLADEWGLVVLPPGMLAASAGELDHLRAAVGLEQAGRLNEAGRAYHAILNRWPESFAALIGLGNVEYAERNYGRAVKYLRKALLVRPASTAARHNLEIAVAHSTSVQ